MGWGVRGGGKGSRRRVGWGGRERGGEEGGGRGEGGRKEGEGGEGEEGGGGEQERWKMGGGRKEST